MISTKIKSLFIALGISSSALAQDADSLLNQLGGNQKHDALTATFKASRIIFTQSTETEKKYDLNFLISHRFGDIGGDFGSSHTLWGLDIAQDLYIGFDYGITSKLTAGIGRSKHNELYNFFLKQKMLEQTKTFPVNATLFAQAGIIAREENSVNEFANGSDRNSYFLQALVSRKFSSAFSLQGSVGYLARPVGSEANDEKGLLSLGLAGRLKVTKRMALVGDYQFSNISRPDNLINTYYNSLGAGLEIETGGHVFALNFCNAPYINENNYIAETLKSWTDGGVRFGFTISRNFTLHKSKNPDINSKIY